jgi:hypothetical protein
MSSYPLACYLIPLGPKYPPQNAIFENPQPTFLSESERPSFSTIQNNRQDYISVYFNFYIANWNPHGYLLFNYVSGQLHILAVLPPGKRPGAHCTGGWVGRSAGLEISSPPGLDARMVESIAVVISAALLRPTRNSISNMANTISQLTAAPCKVALVLKWCRLHGSLSSRRLQL